MNTLAVTPFITDQYPVAIERVARRATAPKISPTTRLHTQSGIATPTSREELAEISKPVLRDSSRTAATNHKRVEAFLTNVLNSGLSSQVLAKAILRNFDMHSPLHTELSQEAVVTALGSVASHAATANLPALFMSALEVLSKLAQASNHPIAEIAARRLYSLRRYENNARTKAQELGINATASHSNQAGVEMAFAA